MPSTKLNSKTARVRNASASRAAILEHAIAEFAAQGVAGARTAAIAEAAGVNKALLYYYFKDKESLYSAALQAVIGGLVEAVLPMLESAIAPGEKILRLARLHFEYLLHHPDYRSFMQQELSRARNLGEPSSDFRAISGSQFVPLQRAGLKAFRDGIASGELRKVDGAGALNILIGMNVFYFMSAPVTRVVRGVDPFSSECVRGHIAASLDLLGASLFRDRDEGIRLAKKISAASTALPREVGGKNLPVNDGKRADL
jgi:TetR/AcrR family transcriptional regulator